MGCEKLSYYQGNTPETFRLKITKGQREKEVPVKKCKDYSPFGLTMAGTSYQRLGTQRNRHLYNGKELQEDLNLDWYDYGARMYDAALGRWHVVDPMIESHYDYTPYAYVYNNPMNFIDPFGLDTIPAIETSKGGKKADETTEGGKKVDDTKGNPQESEAEGSEQNNYE